MSCRNHTPIRMLLCQGTELALSQQSMQLRPAGYSRAGLLYIRRPRRPSSKQKPRTPGRPGWAGSRPIERLMTRARSMSVGSADENSTSQNFTGAYSADDHRANKAVVAPTGSAPALSRAIQATARSQVAVPHSEKKSPDHVGDRG
jgi:hypothetical protein